MDIHFWGKKYHPAYPEAWGTADERGLICEICGKRLEAEELYLRGGTTIDRHGFARDYRYAGHSKCLNNKRRAGRGGDDPREDEMDRWNTGPWETL